MAGARAWLEGARPRTLPAAVVPVVVGTAVAVAEGGVVWGRAALALAVALALQVGVNFANDYSDGVRGADAGRVGPTRLVATGLTTPRRVLAAALGCFAVAVVAGLVLAAATTWWLLPVGAAALAAAWFYTGGRRPYGYRGLGEVAVFLFFGVVAVVGTAYVQLERVTWLALLASVPVGLLACALLVVNNLRDIPSDAAAGKRTLAVILGERRTRQLYAYCLLGAFAIALGLAVARPWTMATLFALPLARLPVRRVARGATGPALIGALAQTGRLQLGFGLLFALGLAL